MSGLFVDLDRSSPIPLYCQAAHQIEQAITQGLLAPGDRLDNEISLAVRFGLSRPTMRRAIQELVDKGLLVRRRGVGTRVVQGRISRPLELTSLFDDLRQQGRAPATTVLINEITRATARSPPGCRSGPGTRCCICVGSGSPGPNHWPSWRTTCPGTWPGSVMTT